MQGQKKIKLCQALIMEMRIPDNWSWKTWRI